MIGLGSEIIPFTSHVLLPPLAYVFKVARIGLHPVDGWIMSRICKPCIKCPESSYESYSMCRHRLCKICSRRRNCTNQSDRPGPISGAKRPYSTGSFIKFCKPRCEVRWVAFLCRHLFKTSRHFTKCLSPAARLVRHKHDIITHVTVVLCHRY